MIDTFGSAERWVFDDWYRIAMDFSYVLLGLVYVLGAVSIVLLLIAHFSKNNTKHYESVILRALIITTAVLSIVLCLINHSNFVDTQEPIYFITLAFSLTCALSATVSCFVFYKKKILLAAFLLIMMIILSFICLPIAINNYKELHVGKVCDCEDPTMYIGEKGIKTPCCHE